MPGYLHSEGPVFNVLSSTTSSPVRVVDPVVQEIVSDATVDTEQVVKAGTSVSFGPSTYNSNPRPIESFSVTVKSASTTRTGYIDFIDFAAGTQGTGMSFRALTGAAWWLAGVGMRGIVGSDANTAMMKTLRVYNDGAVDFTVRVFLSFGDSV